MKTRILAAAVLVPALFLIVLVLPKELAAVIMGILQAIASYELLYRTKLVTKPRLVIYCALMAFAIAVWSFYEAVHAYFVLMVLAFFLLMFSEMMRDHVKMRFETLSMCFVGGLVVPYLMSSVVRILSSNTGRYVILIPFVIACCCDAGAYFIGIRFGKHKLAPVVSPNKTIEGALGGMAAGILAMLLYTFILDLPLRFDVSYGAAIVYGILGCLVGELGDLCFSVIKRQTGIKDYGNLIPGHGGVLDRFDSILAVAPLVEALLLIMPVIIL
ncbi:MAG: phosphatidate cytidylyltransferase [Oscillospiraceae bacterium]|nr:phosphatidate cytidylyltransferase [Oscillospiraceae bacterium]